MRFAKVDSKYYCGIDLHSRSMYISVMDKEGEILFHRNMPNDFDIFKNYVEHLQPNMAVGSNRVATTIGSPMPAKKQTSHFISAMLTNMKAINGGKVKNDRVDLIMKYALRHF